MRIFILVLVLALVSLSIYLGWVGMYAADDRGKSQLIVTVNKDKITQDKQKTQETLEDLASEAKRDMATTRPATGRRQERILYEP